MAPAGQRGGRLKGACGQRTSASVPPGFLRLSCNYYLPIVRFCSRFLKKQLSGSGQQNKSMKMHP